MKNKVLGCLLFVSAFSSSALACRFDVDGAKKLLVEQAKAAIADAGIEVQDFSLPSEDEMTFDFRYLVNDAGIDCPDTREIAFRIRLQSEQKENLRCSRNVYATTGLLGNQSFVSKAHCRSM